MNSTKPNSPTTRGENPSGDIDDKINKWAEATRYHLIFYDLRESFGPSTVPPQERRIQTKNGYECKGIGNAIWRAGNEAIIFLQAALTKNSDEDHEVTIDEIHKDLPSLLRQAEDFLDETLYPTIQWMIKEGRIRLNIPAEEFPSSWLDQTFAHKAIMLFDLFDTQLNILNNLFEDDQLPRKIAALAILDAIDDCVVAGMDDGIGLTDTIEKIYVFRGVLSASKAPQLEINQLKKIAMSERGADLAKRRHQKTNEAREWIVAEWRSHSISYDGNKSAFARHYVRRLANEREVTVTEKQLREVWLKDTLSARKPDGMPADRE